MAADRKNKAKAFSESQKVKNQQAQQEKTHLIPDVEWQSTDTLPLRGDVAEALQQNIIGAFELIQRAGQAFQVFMNMAIKSGAAKLTYTWNNGEKPTPDEIAEYQTQIDELQRLKAEQLKNAQEGIKQEMAAQKAPKTNLVTTDGAPLTEENLDNSKKIII